MAVEQKATQRSYWKIREEVQQMVRQKVEQELGQKAEQEFGQKAG